MTGRRQRRAALAVIAAAALATVLTTSITAAGALDAIDPVEAVVSTTTSIVEEVVEAVTGESATADDGGGRTTTTTSTSTTTTTSTSTTTTTSTSTTIAPVTTTTAAPAVVTDAAAAASEPAATDPPAPIVSEAAEPHPVVTPAVTLATPSALATPAGPRSTLDVLDLLRPRGATPQLIARVLAPFPVAGRAHYSNDWGALRHGPPVHSHEGTDIFAERGTPVIASGDGVISRMTTAGRLGGTSLRLTTASGTFFYYAHLDRFAAGLENGARVETGDVLGFVGNTGNAATTPPHLHYEVHLDGGEAVPPVPYLDRWLDEAKTTARSIVLSPAVDAVVAVRPSIDVTADDPVAFAARTPQRLKVRSINGQPASAVDPVPLLTVAGPIIGVSWLAHRGKKRARRRLHGSAR